MANTEYLELEKWFNQLEVIINPNFLSAFKKQLYRVYEENKKDAYEAAKISDEALKIEKLLNDLRGRIKQHDNKQINRFHLKCFYKEIIELLNNKS